MGMKLKDCKSNSETLALLQMIHGKDVICTDGLFHIIDNNHREAYINPTDASFDKRGLYNTLVVMDSIIVSKVVNNSKIRFVILTKGDLKCIYKTTGNIYYIDDNLVCDKHGNDCMLISHSGKNTWKYKDAICVNKVHKNCYLITSEGMFQDKLILYYPQKDVIKDMTENKRYAIHRITDSKISIASMAGGKYTYDFQTRQCLDEFTDTQIDTITLFS